MISAQEWNEKHPIGTRVMIKGHYLMAFHTCEKARMAFGYIPSVKLFGFGDACIDRLVPISAYPGDMYEGKALKKVSSKDHVLEHLQGGEA